MALVCLLLSVALIGCKENNFKVNIIKSNYSNSNYHITNKSGDTVEVWLQTSSNNSRWKEIVRGTNKESINDIRLSKFLASYSEKDEQNIIESAGDFIFFNINEYKKRIK